MFKKKKKKSFGDKLRDFLAFWKDDDTYYEQLEEILIEGDIGALLSVEIVDELREYVRKERINKKECINDALYAILGNYIFTGDVGLEQDGLTVFLVLGVNGVGKTTTIAKLASFFKQHRGVSSVVLAAGDTFRAAAIDQLKIQAERTSCRIVAQSPGSDPGAVVFDAIDSALAKKEELLIVDTAGRMHNKDNLVKQLQKINKIIENKTSTGRCRHLLIIDATTGQNGFRQAEIFNEAIKIDGIVLTKYDSAAKGGIIIPINHFLKIPILYLGTGETLDSLEPFDKKKFLDSLLA